MASDNGVGGGNGRGVSTRNSEGDSEIAALAEELRSLGVTADNPKSRLEQQLRTWSLLRNLINRVLDLLVGVKSKSFLGSASIVDGLEKLLKNLSLVEDRLVQGISTGPQPIKRDGSRHLLYAEEWSPISSPDMSPRNHHFGDDDLSRYGAHGIDRIGRRGEGGELESSEVADMEPTALPSTSALDIYLRDSEISLNQYYQRVVRCVGTMEIQQRIKSNRMRALKPGVLEYLLTSLIDQGNMSSVIGLSKSQDFLLDRRSLITQALNAPSSQVVFNDLELDQLNTELVLVDHALQINKSLIRQVHTAFTLKERGVKYTTAREPEVEIRRPRRNDDHSGEHQPQSRNLHHTGFGFVPSQMEDRKTWADFQRNSQELPQPRRGFLFTPSSSNCDPRGFNFNNPGMLFHMKSNGENQHPNHPRVERNYWAEVEEALEREQRESECITAPSAAQYNDPRSGATVTIHSNPNENFYPRNAFNMNRAEQNGTAVRHPTVNYNTPGGWYYLPHMPVAAAPNNTHPLTQWHSLQGNGHMNHDEWTHNLAPSVHRDNPRAQANSTQQPVRQSCRVENDTPAARYQNDDSQRSSVGSGGNATTEFGDIDKTSSEDKRLRDIHLNITQLLQLASRHTDILREQRKSIRTIESAFLTLRQDVTDIREEIKEIASLTRRMNEERNVREQFEESNSNTNIIDEFPRNLEVPESSRRTEFWATGDVPSTMNISPHQNAIHSDENTELSNPRRGADSLNSQQEFYELNSNPSSMLNNQVPPGTRANNYWDNFKSYSRLNMLSSSKVNIPSNGMSPSGSEGRTICNEELMSNIPSSSSRRHSRGDQNNGSKKSSISANFVENIGLKKGNRDIKTQLASPCRSSSSNSIPSQNDQINGSNMGLSMTLPSSKHVVSPTILETNNDSHSRAGCGDGVQNQMTSEKRSDSSQSEPEILGNPASSPSAPSSMELELFQVLENSPKPVENCVQPTEEQNITVNSDESLLNVLETVGTTLNRETANVDLEIRSHRPLSTNAPSEACNSSLEELVCMFDINGDENS